ncbi:MAG: type II toxin-antitoxin system VapC family toxin [Thioploca sp.]|nr:type II toxin-antitoxin system VapC family toxin [Thioploca sp.]
MKILLDTCSFLWFVTDSPQLTAVAREIFKNVDNAVYLSVISAWEMIIKYQLGKLPLPKDPMSFIEIQRQLHHIESLSLDESSVSQLIKLPDLHRDPFDRILICQAIEKDLIILTPDPWIQQYPVRTLLW